MVSVTHQVFVCVCVCVCVCVRACVCVSVCVSVLLCTMDYLFLKFNVDQCSTIDISLTLIYSVGAKTFEQSMGGFMNFEHLCLMEPPSLRATRSIKKEVISSLEMCDCELVMTSPIMRSIHGLRLVVIYTFCSTL